MELNNEDDLDALFNEDIIEDDKLSTEETAEAPATGQADQTDEKENPTVQREATEAQNGEAQATKNGEEIQDEPTQEQAQSPAPITKEDVKDIIQNIRSEERDSSKELDSLTDEVMSTYYPEGLSNVLVDERTGKELRTPNDVIEAFGGDMSVEEAQKWLLNEQYKLDRSIVEIKDQARELAQVNSNFRSGIKRVIDKYENVFKAYPEVQQRVYEGYMAQVKMHEQNKDIVLSAPDIEDFYSLVMQPYELAYAHAQSQSLAQQAPQAQTPTIPDAPKPSYRDRLDEGGDAGSNVGDKAVDMNDAQEALDDLFGEG